jgi:hypothetical protein
MNGTVRDIRLPGGSVFGKVINYRMMVNGDTGVVKGSVILGCSIGKEIIDFSGTPQSPRPSLSDPGVPPYVAEGYVDSGYQEYLPT